MESQLADARALGSLSCVTGDDGDAWATSQGGGFDSGVDHQTLGWGPYAPKTVPVTGSFPSELYYRSQDIADASCSTSSDGGTTFGPAVPMYDLTQCTGIHGRVKIAPDGTAYVPNKSCGGHPAVVVSNDNGLHRAIRPVPTGTSGASDPSVSIGKGGTVYLSWNGSDNHLFTAVSRDRGETWTNVQDVGAQLGIVNNAFPAAVAGDDNLAAVAFLGTTTAGDSSATDAFTGVWQLDVATTVDGGATWKTVNATGADPVQRGRCAPTAHLRERPQPPGLHRRHDRPGRPRPGRLCRRLHRRLCHDTAPTATTSGYRDALATIARQTTGPRMYRAADPLPDLTGGAIHVSRGADSHEHASALLSNKGSAAASAAVRFFDGCGTCGAKTIATSTPVTLAPVKSVRVSVTWTTATPGTHTVTAVADPVNKIRESRESNNKCQAAVTVT